jgi:hypothetical protein
VTTKQVSRTGGRAGTGGETRCTRCGAPFHCGLDDPGGCWCAGLPPLPPEAYVDGAGCLCERCLRDALATPPTVARRP